MVMILLYVAGLTRWLEKDNCNVQVRFHYLRRKLWIETEILRVLACTEDTHTHTQHRQR